MDKKALFTTAHKITETWCERRGMNAPKALCDELAANIRV